MTTEETTNLAWDKPIFPSDNLASELDTLVDQIDADVAALGGEWSVSDSGVELLTGPGDLNFGSLLAVTDDGDDSVTIDADLSAHEGDADIHHTRYSDTEAVTAVNNDTDHGSTASHNYFTSSEAITAVNNHADHGSTASHNYFSGSHADLSNITSSDHHSKTTSLVDITDFSSDSENIYYQSSEPASPVDGDIWIEP